MFRNSPVDPIKFKKIPLKDNVYTCWPGALFCWFFVCSSSFIHYKYRSVSKLVPCCQFNYSLWLLITLFNVSFVTQVFSTLCYNFLTSVRLASFWKLSRSWWPHSLFLFEEFYEVFRDEFISFCQGNALLLLFRLKRLLSKWNFAELSCIRIYNVAKAKESVRKRGKIKAVFTKQ